MVIPALSFYHSRESGNPYKQLIFNKIHLGFVKSGFNPDSLLEKYRNWFHRSDQFFDPYGGMAERFKAHAWKACWRQRLGGSNPPPSAIKTMAIKIYDPIKT